MTDARPAHHQLPRIGGAQIGPDTVLALDEPDYLYGLGTLVLRIDRLLADPLTLRSVEWVRVTGRQIHWDGSETPRDVMVRVAALGRARRPVGWRPDRYRRVS